MLMRIPIRRTAMTTATAVAFSTAALLGLQPGAHAATAAPATSEPTSGPKNAANVFLWGPALWRQEFESFSGPLSDKWHSSRPNALVQENGMLAIQPPQNGGTVTATWFGSPRRYGRWETRMRVKQFSTGHTPYRASFELVPVGGDGHCGARTITVASYVVGTQLAHFHIHTLPNNDFAATEVMSPSADTFHTYAIEITRKHISWFADTHVLMTERRSAALSGVEYRPRFIIQAVPGATMNDSWMQLDWVRGYDLHRPDAKSIAAPRAKRGTYAQAC
jgi:hypothetical protein